MQKSNRLAFSLSGPDQILQQTVTIGEDKTQIHLYGDNYEHLFVHEPGIFYYLTQSHVISIYLFKSRLFIVGLSCLLILSSLLILLRFLPLLLELVGKSGSSLYWNGKKTKDSGDDSHAGKNYYVSPKRQIPKTAICNRIAKNNRKSKHSSRHPKYFASMLGILILLANNLKCSDARQIENCSPDDICEDGCQLEDVDHDVGVGGQLASIFAQKDNATSDGKLANGQFEVGGDKDSNVVEQCEYGEDDELSDP